MEIAVGCALARLGVMRELMKISEKGSGVTERRSNTIFSFLCFMGFKPF